MLAMHLPYLLKYDKLNVPLSCPRRNLISQEFSGYRARIIRSICISIREIREKSHIRMGIFCKSPRVIIPETIPNDEIKT